jgi:hypothetical protein
VRAAAQFTGGNPSAAPKLMMSLALVSDLIP